jgi:hypothetical protein
MSNPPSEPEAPERLVRVPRDEAETSTLLDARPPGWEYLLFAGRLMQGRTALRIARREHELAVPSGPYRRLDVDEVTDHLSTEFGHLSWVIEPMERLFAAQEDAFGAPGESGDAELIEHFADWIVGVYRRLMDWASRIRSVDVPEEFEPAVKLWAHAADASIEEISDFIEATSTRLDEVAFAMADSPSGAQDEPISVELTLTLTVDDALVEEGLAMLRDAVARLEAQRTDSD